MVTEKKTKAQLVNEINLLKSRVAELEDESENKESESVKYPRDFSFYQTILENVIDGVWAADANDVIYFTNRGMELISGVPREKIVGKNFLKEFAPQSISELKNYYLRAKKTGHPIYYHDIPVLTQTSRLSYQSGWFIPYQKNDVFCGIICTVQDATRQKQTDEELSRYREHLEELVSARTAALSEVNKQLNDEVEKHRQTEKALAEQQYLLQTLMDNIPDTIYFKDCQSRFIRISRAHAQKFGLNDPAESVGKTDFDFFTNEHARQAFADEQKIIKTGQPLVDFEEVETWPDGSETWVSTSKVPLRNSENEVIGTFGISRDITDKKQSEWLLKESEERYRIICENSVDLISIVGFDGLITYVSPSHETILGYKAEEIIGKTAGKFIHREDKAKILSLVQKYLAILSSSPLQSGQSLGTDTIRIRVFDKAGNIHYLEMRGNFTKKGIIITSQDISEKVQADLALRESEKKYRELVNNTHIGIYIVQKYILKFCNQKVADFFGYDSPAGMIGKHLKELIAPESWNTVETEIVLRETGRKKVSNYQFKAIRKDGTFFDVEVFGRRTIYEGNIGIQGTMLDITERKRALEDLKISEERFRRVACSIRDGITIVEKGTVVYTNDRACEIFGYPKNEFVKKTIFDFVSPGSQEEIRRIKHEMEQEGILIKEFDLWINRKDGSRRFVHHQFSISRNESKPIGHFIVTTDITTRKLAEEKLKASLNEKEVLLREVHHRVKNNLQVISSLLNLQSNYIKNGEVLELFKESQNRVKSMALIHERLYQSKDLANIDFGEYVNGLVRQLFVSYKVKSKTIIYDINIHNIFMDINTAIPCGLIINELITNSLKHAFPRSKGGQINLKLKRTRNNTFELVVADNGIGFPAQIDFRATESLGLQLVVTLVEQLAGKIKLENKNGTTFRITFKNIKMKHKKIPEPVV